MAKAVPETEFDLKKRLLGAFILIGFGVVVLPRLLGGQAVGVTPVSEEPAAVDNTKVFISKITPIGGPTPKIDKSLILQADSADESGGREETVKALKLETGKQEVIEKLDTRVKINPKKVITTGLNAGKGDGKKSAQKKSATKVAKVEQAAPEPKPAKPTDEPGWVVRVGTFVKRENAARVMERLRAAGFEPSSGEIRTDKGVGLRVWVGPYSQRVQAARIRNEVLQATGEKGFIAAFP